MQQAIIMVAAIAVLLFGCVEDGAEISGTATDCVVPGQQRRITGLDVRAYDPAAHSGLVAVLRSLDTLPIDSPDPAVTERWNTAYFRLEELWKNAAPLALDSTSSNGGFSLSVPSMDSVLVLSLNDSEGQPSYYEYKMLGGRSNTSFVLDMSSGMCGMSTQQGAIQRTATDQPVILTGPAVDCEAGQIVRISDLEVRALDPLKNQNLASLLKNMDTVTWVGDGIESMNRYEDLYEQVVALLHSSTPLAQDTTTATGIFRLSVSPSDSVLVIGQADIEDVPVFYGYKVVRARRNVTFELPMFRRECVKPKPSQRTGSRIVRSATCPA